MTAGTFTNTRAAHIGYYSAQMPFRQQQILWSPINLSKEFYHTTVICEILSIY